MYPFSLLERYSCTTNNNNKIRFLVVYVLESLSLTIKPELSKQKLKVGKKFLKAKSIYHSILLFSSTITFVHGGDSSLRSNRLSYIYIGKITFIYLGC